jgi:hypothetical protein
MTHANITKPPNTQPHKYKQSSKEKKGGGVEETNTREELLTSLYVIFFVKSMDI